MPGCWGQVYAFHPYVGVFHCDTIAILAHPRCKRGRWGFFTGWRFTNHCIENKHLVLYAWVIMTNHIHLAARCDPPGGMSAFLRDFKKFTSKKIVDTIENISESRKEWLLDKFSFEARRTRRPENYKVWKDDNHAIGLSHNDIMKKINYIHNNPVRAGLVDFPEHYVYSSARDFSGVKGLVNVTVV